MRVLSITSLSSWIHCKRQFFVQNVLKVKEPMNEAMVLGSIKHKFHELCGENEQRIISSIKDGGIVGDVVQKEYLDLLRKSIMTYVGALRSVSVLPSAAFQRSVQAVSFEAVSRSKIIEPLFASGLRGLDLWDSLQPKVKNEYSIQSKKLGLKGRIDKLECYPDRLLPIELKSGKTPEVGVFETHKIQAASYAILLSEMFGSQVSEAVVHYVDSDSRRSIIVDDSVREWVLTTASLARECIDNRSLPVGCGVCPACKLCDDSDYISRALSNLDSA